MASIASATGALTTQATNTASNSALSNLSGNFDTFIKLLTSQLKYQDPMEPTDVAKFTEQLVQYSQVEQQIGTNSKLDNVLAALSVAGGNAYLNYIGNTVEVDSSNLILKGGNGTVGYTLPDVASATKIEVYDKNGTLVKTLSGDNTIGRHTVTWDGKNEAGSVQQDGLYTFKVSATNSAGDAIPTARLKPFLVAKVQGIRADPAEGALLDLGGGITVNPGQVYAVRESASSI